MFNALASRKRCTRLLTSYFKSLNERANPFGIGSGIGSPTRARTWDLRINSPSLYQLSYQGMKRGSYCTASVAVRSKKPEVSMACLGSFRTNVRKHASRRIFYRTAVIERAT